jgi:hypothetical protein
MFRVWLKPQSKKDFSDSTSPIRTADSPLRDNLKIEDIFDTPLASQGK